MTDALPQDFTPGELNTWSAVATLLEWLPAALDSQLQRDSGISHFEFGILYALAHADGPLRMSELAGYANSTLSRLSRAVARLERAGWARREVDPSDGRVTLAHITDEGRRAQASAAPGHVALVRRLVFERLTAEETRALGASSRRIVDAIDDGAWRPSS